MAKRKLVEIDVLSHSLVPEMKILKNSEKDKMLSKFGISETQLPKILSDDPEVRALNAKVGDVLAIERKDLTGSYTSYRLIIS